MATNSLCSIPNCGKRLFAKGWCTAHYSRWSRHGSPFASAPVKEKRICSVDGCSRKHEAHGFCNNHYRSWRLHGDPLKSEQWGKQTVCTIEGCGKPHYAHGLCAAHNWRRRANGSPTAGRVPNGEAWKFYEEVVLHFYGDECYRWPYTHNKKGYPVMARHGEKRSMLVHRLGCEHRNGPPPFPNAQTCHTCGHEWCCNLGHTRWDTQAGNEADKVAHGTSQRRLTEENVRAIRALFATLSVSAIARQFGVAQSTIHALRSGRTWSWLDN